MGYGPINLTSAQDRRLDLVAFYSAWMEAEHRGTVEQDVAKTDDGEQVRSDRTKRDWRGTQSSQELAEDQVLIADGASRHLRNTPFVPQNLQVVVADKQSRETRDAIEGSGRRSIPKGSIGRGTMSGRTQQSLHVDASRNTGQLGPQKTTLHRPQGFGGGRGSVVFV